MPGRYGQCKKNEKMKNTLLTIFLIGTVRLLSAQNYVYFPDSNVTWTYLQCETILTIPDPYQSCHTIYFSFSGDTVINSIQYRKMYSASSTTFPVYCAGVRKDFLRRVFILNEGETTEDLKFNFSGSIGDTMQTNPIKTISFIDSVIVSGSYHDRYILSSHDTIIEGIGNINDIIIPLYSPGGLGRFILLCMTIDSLIYKNNHYNTCDTSFYGTLGISKENEVFRNLKIYPNPFNQRTVIEFNNKDQKILSMTIMNISGQILRSISNINTSSVEIERQNLSSGLYFIKVFNDKEMIACGRLSVE